MTPAAESPCARRAKIVCTLGPATSSQEAIAALLDAGMSVARMNFSHGDHVDHEVVFHRLRSAAKASGAALAIMADLQGPKIRLGRFEAGPYEWNTGDTVTITVQDIVGTRDRVSTNQGQPAPPPGSDDPQRRLLDGLTRLYDDLLDCIRTGDRPAITVADGLETLRVVPLQESARAGQPVTLTADQPVIPSRP